MLIITAQNFIGAIQQIQPKRLPDGFGVEARNMRLGFGDLRPYGAASVCYTIGGATTQRNTLYRLRVWVALPRATRNIGYRG